MLFLCVNVYCHRVTTQLQLINIIIKTSLGRPRHEWENNIKTDTRWLEFNMVGFLGYIGTRNFFTNRISIGCPKKTLYIGVSNLMLTCWSPAGPHIWPECPRAANPWPSWLLLSFCCSTGIGCGVAYRPSASSIPSTFLHVKYAKINFNLKGKDV